MKQFLITLTGFTLACFVCSCSQNKQAPNTSDAMTDSISNSMMTKSDQEHLSPDDVIASLKKGNQEFVKDRLTVRNNTTRVQAASYGQYPEAIVLSCIDSRVPVEDIFHKGIGDLFVTRVAGNVIDEDILGSLEYACKISGSKVIVVLGHEHCGAIKAAVDNEKLGNVTALLAKIEPVVQDEKSKFKEDTTSKNEKFVADVCQKNVLHSIEYIRKQSPVLKEMEEKGQIKIIGAVYNMESGVVDFL